MIRITLSLDNFTGDLCGIRFDKSVATIEGEPTIVQRRSISRLPTLYSGTKVETVDSAPAPDARAGEAPETLARADEPAQSAPASSDDIVEEKPKRRRSLR